MGASKCYDVQLHECCVSLTNDPKITREPDVKGGGRYSQNQYEIIIHVFRILVLAFSTLP